MFRGLSVVLVALLTGCVSTLPKSVAGTHSQSVLKVSHSHNLEESRLVKRDETLIKLTVTPNRVARLQNEVVIPIQTGGFFKLGKDARLFEVESREFGLVYCGYTNLFRNKLKTKFSEGCLGDSNNDRQFDTYYIKTGNIPTVSVGFVYQDSEIVLAVPKGTPVQAPYIIEDADQSDRRHISYRFDKIKKQDGKRIAIFEIVTKDPSDEKWRFFKTRNPITVAFDGNTNQAVFETPLFSIQLTEATNSKFRAQIISINDVAGLGFKKSLEDAGDPRYSPAYQTTGY